MPHLQHDEPLTTTEYALLGMLARYGECSGYELLRQAHEGVGFFWSPAKSHVYEVLPRLERRGLARRRMIAQDGKPDKHLWRLTRQGRGTLRRWIAVPERDPFSNRSVLLLKLFFGDYGEPAALVVLLERYRDQARSRLTELQSIEVDADFVEPDELPRLALRFGLNHVEAQLVWAESILPELRARVLAGSPISSAAADQPNLEGKC